MIYNIDNNFHQIESYKERNLYYKIFAGYLFNELIPGYLERKDGFFNLLTSLLKNPDRFSGSEENIKDILAESRKLDAHITFCLLYTSRCV